MVPVAPAPASPEPMITEPLTPADPPSPEERERVPLDVALLAPLASDTCPPDKASLDPLAMLTLPPAPESPLPTDREI
jgi:hypothetical protein